jgi:hypothetical protein
MGASAEDRAGIDVTNWALVGLRVGDGAITIQFPPTAGGITKKEALVFAAWLVAVADPGDEEFPAILEAVRST